MSTETSSTPGHALVGESISVSLTAKDLPARRRWYRNLAGFKVEQEHRAGGHAVGRPDVPAPIPMASGWGWPRHVRHVPRSLLPVLALAAGAGSLAPRAAAAQEALGTVDFRVSCTAPAQAEFNRAVALLHHMTYPQAQASFQRVAALDSRCAMAHWGIAMTLFQPLWPTRPSPAALQRGWDEVLKARAIEPVSDRERGFVATAEAFFLEPAGTDYWLRIRRWEEANETLLAAFPDDPEAAAFTALAHLATTPPDSISRSHADRAATLLLRVYERNPEHPGAMHYLVHADDVPGRERETPGITRKYESVAPANPHALHMPTHVYTRLGEWDAAIRGNLRAADAALAHPAGETGDLVWDEFPHAIEYLVYAYLQQGADAQAAGQVARLRATPRIEATFKTAFHLASTQARYVLDRKAWGEATQIVPREPATLAWDRFAWPEAIARFARGLGAVRSGNVADAATVTTRLRELEANMTRANEVVFARNIAVLRIELDAWRQHAEGRRDDARALMREAADLETRMPKHAVTPGPTIPAHELMGDLLMEQRRPAEALAAYTRALALYPRRFNGLLGAAQAARAAGDSATARRWYLQLIEVADSGSSRSGLREARDFVARR